MLRRRGANDSNPAFGTTEIESNTKGLAIAGRPFLLEIAPFLHFSRHPTPNLHPESIMCASFGALDYGYFKP
jgi:hypothetical protein